MKRKLRKFWDKQRGTIILVMLGIVVFAMTVISSMGIADEDGGEQLAWLPTGYHGLGWKNFGYLNPVPSSSNLGTYGNVLTSSSRGFAGGLGTMSFVGAGGGIAGIVGLTGGFGGGSGGDGGEGGGEGGGSGSPAPASLVLVNNDGDIPEGCEIFSDAPGLITCEGENESPVVKKRLDCDDEDECDIYSDTHPIPEPATMFLFGSGAIGAALRRRKK